MPELIVIDRIDGSPVAWRCSQCRQVFTSAGKMTAEERRRKVTDAFRAHSQQAHAVETPAGANRDTGQVCRS